MNEYIYRIQMKDGQWLVSVRPACFLDMIHHAMLEDEIVSDNHWLARGSEIASVTREAV